MALFFRTANTDPPASFLALAGRSLLRGAIGGWICAYLYATFVIPVVSGWIVATNLFNERFAFGERFPEALIGAGIFLICAWPCALPLGMLPGALVGGLGGLAIGMATAILRRWLMPWGGAMIGLVVAAAWMAGLHLALGQGLLENNEAGALRFAPYLFWLGVPGVIMAAGFARQGWVTVREARRQAVD